MKITKITPVGKRPVYDISVGTTQHYILKNGVVTHNTGIYLSADNIWIIGRQTDKDGKEIQGYNFVITIEKSRHVKEKSKIPIGISYKSGIDKYSGLLDLALEAGLIVQSGAWYQMVDLETGEVNPKKIRSAAIDGPEVWEPILANQKFKDFVKAKYKIGEAKMMQNEVEDFFEDLETDEE